MADALVGGAFLSAFLQVLFDRMASRELISFFRTQKLDDALLRQLKTTFMAFNVVLDDAEEKQIINQTVKAWLNELKDATYEAEDLLDEIATEASRCKLEAEFPTTTDQVPNSNSSTSLNPFDAESMNSKIKVILNKLEDLAKQKMFLGLKEGIGGQPSQRLPPTTSLVEEGGIYGRDDDEEKIMESLLSDDASGNKIGVITIVGMGGLGKTTLAQLLYNNENVKKHFGLQAWVCVSEEFDVFRVTKTLFEAVNSSACDINDLNLLQVKLRESFSGKKFLVVLDDVWNENYVHWDVLRKPFSSGANGSKIIVTTRNERVAWIMHTDPTYHLKQLSEKDCWLLFAKHAFDHANSNAHPTLKEIGRKIVKKCKGLPLAAKTLGGLLRSIQDADEWDKILNSDIWDLPNSNILPALRLSYHYLPFHLKQCFAYCSIFPKDYVFNKEKLVRLWMAEDLSKNPKGGNKSLEEVGDENFCHLALRSFFQQSGGDKSRFVMHDLINDLAQFVSKEFYHRLEGDSSCEIPEKTRHLSYCQTKYDAFEKFGALYKAKCLRTFLPLSLQGNFCFLTKKVPHDLLPTLSHLRVLSLAYYINISELPESIGSLKHLRFVDLSHTAITKLPNSTSTLFNLQTLILFKCNSLIELPKDMSRLINLSYLNIGGTNLKEMPRHMNRLRSLQTLSTFVVSKHSGSKITELRELQHLRGALHIKELQNVNHARDASEANLKEQKYLDKLELEWGTDIEDSQNGRDVLDNLQPHASLKHLIIQCYSSTRFPNWLGDNSFCNMVTLRLCNCKYCFCLPTLGQLPCLKDLFIKGFEAVGTVGPEFYGNGGSAIKPFGSLETLVVEDMSEWVEWFCQEDECGGFPCLRELRIRNCPKLNGGLPSHLPSLIELLIYDCQLLAASLPRAPAIRELHLRGCDKVVWISNDELTAHPSLCVPQTSNVPCQPHDQITTLPDRVGLQHLSFIEILELSGVSQLKELPPRLRELRLFECSCLKSIPEGGVPATLKVLYIENCDSIKSVALGIFPDLTHLSFWRCKTLESLTIPEGFHEDFKSLGSLEIVNCPKFVSFPKGGLPTPNLSFFWVASCGNLKSLPERMHTLLPSLKILMIYECPELESFPEGGLPPNLQSLLVRRCDKLTARWMDWGLQTLASLTSFGIECRGEVESFPEKWLLPSTLAFLFISQFLNLKYLDHRGLQHLTSLKELRISNCPNLQCLPEEGLPPSLYSLEIWESPLLEQRCQRENEDWSKIAHIPSIRIGRKLIS